MEYIGVTFIPNLIRINVNQQVEKVLTVMSSNSKPAQFAKL